MNQIVIFKGGEKKKRKKKEKTHHRQNASPPLTCVSPIGKGCGSFQQHGENVFLKWKCIFEN